MNKGLWVIQIILAVFFFFTGVMHFILPESLPQQMAWMYDMSTPMHIFTGVAEILGALGLILPALTRIQARLVPLAAAGLAVLMVGAVVFHISRAEYSNVMTNLILGLLAAFVAYERWKMIPFMDKQVPITE